MKNFCLLPSCDNFNGEENIDCLLENVNVAQKAITSILEHYNALKEKYAKLEEKRVQKGAHNVETMRKRAGADEPEVTIKTRKLNDDSKPLPQQKETEHQKPYFLLQKLNIGSKVSLHQSDDKQQAPEGKKRVTPPGRAVFEMKRRSTVDSSLLKRQQANHPKKQTKPNASPSRPSPGSKHNDAILEPSENLSLFSPSVTALEKEYLKLDELNKDKPLKTPEKVKSKSNSPFDTNIFIKREKLSPKAQSQKKLDSPELFLPDSNSSSVIYVSPSAEKIYTVCEFSPDPKREARLAMAARILKVDKYLDDSSSDNQPKQEEKEDEERDRYEGECDYCALHYDEMVQKFCVETANQTLKVCTNDCKGYRARCAKLKKCHKSDNSSKASKDNDENSANKMQTIRTKLDEQRKRRERGLVNDQLDPNATPAGFWDLPISPRKSSPLFKRKKNPWFDTQELQELES